MGTVVVTFWYAYVRAIGGDVRVIGDDVRRVILRRRIQAADDAS